jgi:hypothetical protein
MKICRKALSDASTLPIALGSDNKRYTFNNIMEERLVVVLMKLYPSISADNITGEVHSK